MNVLRLMRRDPAFRLTTLFALGALGFPLFVQGLLHAALGHSIGSEFVDILVFTTLPAMVLGAGIPIAWHLGPATRASEFELGLPLSARTLWLSRIGSLFALILVTLGALAIGNSLFDSRALHAPVVSLCAHLAAGVLLTITGLQALNPTENCARPGWRLMSCGAAGLVITSLLATFRFAPASLAAVGVAAVVLARTYRMLPRAFTLGSARASTDVESASESNRDHNPARHLRPAALLRRVLLDHTVRNWVAALLLATVGLSALVSAAVPIAAATAAIACASLVTFSAQALRKVGSLPISKRRVFAYAALPGLLVLIGATVAGLYLSSALKTRGDLVRLRWAETKSLKAGEALRRAVEPSSESAPPASSNPASSTHLERYQRIVIPYSCWRIALDGNPPEIRLDTGERFVPYRHPLGWGVAAAYNPYDTAPNSSTAFVALQLSRALKDLHRIDRSPDWIESEVLRPHAPSTPHELRADSDRISEVVHELAENGLSDRFDRLTKELKANRKEPSAREKLEAIVADAESAEPISFAVRAAIQVATLLLAWGLSVTYILRLQTPTVTRRSRLGRIAAAAALCVGFLAIVAGGFALDQMDPDLLGVFLPHLVIQLAIWLPSHPLFAWGFVALFGVGVVRLVEGVFRRSEVPTRVSGDAAERRFQRI